MGLSKKEALEKLDRAIKEIDSLTKYGSTERNPTFIKWREDTITALNYIFGNPTKTFRFSGISYAEGALLAARTGNDSAPYLNGLMKARAILLSMQQEVEEYWKEEPQPFKK